MAREKRKRSGGGGKVVPFLLGLLMGIIILAGSLFGVGYYAYSRPTKKAVNLADKFISGDLYSKVFGSDEVVGILDASYAEKKVGELLNDSVQALSALSGEGTLNDINDIFPKAKTLAEKFLTNFTESFGAPVNIDTFMSTPVMQLSRCLSDAIQNAALADMFMSMNNGAAITDPVMLAICYGSPAHYAVGEDGKPVIGKDGKPVMNQIRYILQDKGEGEKLYDVDGNAVDGYDATKKTVTFEDGTVHYLSATALASVATSTTYYAYLDEGGTQAAYYPVTRVKELSTNASSLINRLYLSDALNVNNQSHKVLITLAYGSEENYTVDKDGTITPKDGIPPRTIGDLKANNKEIIDGIYLKDALTITPSSHKVLISLAYGKENVDYQIVDKTDANGNPVKDDNGNVVKIIKPINTPRTIGELSANSTALIDGILLSDVLKEDQSSAVTMYMLYGKKGIHYELVDKTDGEGNPVKDTEGKTVQETKLLPKRILSYNGKPYNGYGEVFPDTYTISEENTPTLTITDNTNPENPQSTTQTLSKQTATQTITITTKDAEGKEVKEDVEATVYYILKDATVTEGKPEDIYVYYEATTLGGLNSNNMLGKITARLTIGELMKKEEIEKNMFLKHLQNETVDDLPEAVSNLTIEQVYREKFTYRQYNGYRIIAEGDEKGKHADYAASYTDNNGKTVTIGDYIDNDYNLLCTKANYDTNNVDKTTLVLSGAWKYLLEDTSGTMHDYKITEMEKLIDNMMNNMKVRTLNELNDDGFVELSVNTMDTEIIDKIEFKVGSKTVSYAVAGFVDNPDTTDVNEQESYHNKKFVGQLTVSEILTYVGNVLTAIDQINGQTFGI